MPKLSILLPTYNGAPYLDEQLDSIVAQSDPDFELLAIDDGSSDATRDMLAARAAREPRMRVIPSAGNRGQTERLAELIAAAAGEYVAISDQDDRWAPDRNARLFAAIGDAPMALGRSELIDAAGALVGRALMDESNVLPGAHVRLRALLEPMFSAHATITRRDRISAAAFNHPLPFDWLMAMEALFGGGLAYVNEAVVFHRIHGSNQNNHIALAGARKWSPSHLRWLLLYQRPLRMKFWLMLDYLGKSPAVEGGVRALFRRLAGRCYATWFSEWRSLRSADAGLRDEIRQGLRPHAGSEADWAYFVAQVDALTALPGGAGMLRDVRRRWRLD